MNVSSSDDFVLAVLCLNSGEHLVTTLNSVALAITASGSEDRADIVIVDDGSTDYTNDIAIREMRKLTSRGFRTQLVIHPTNKGMAAGIVSAARISKTKYLIPVQGAESRDTDELTRTFMLREFADLTVLQRKQLSKVRPPMKVLSSWLLNRVAAPLFGYRDGEVTGAYIMRREDALRFIPEEAGHGWPFYITAGCQAAQRIIARGETSLLPDRMGSRTNVLPRPRHAMQVLRALIFARKHARSIVYRSQRSSDDIDSL